MEATPELSLVILAFDEQECITDCVREARDVLKRTGRLFEIIVVDDGSTDGTYRVLRRLKPSVPELRPLRLTYHCGQTAALDAGFKAARGDVIVTMDGDLQNDPADIPSLLQLIGDWDVVCGYRKKRQDSLVRRASSRIANWVRNRLTHETIRDVGCSLRALKAECVRGLKLYDGMHRFLPTLLKLDGWRVTEVPVNHRARRTGKTKYGIRNRFFRGLRDLMAVRWMQSRWLRYHVEEENE